MVKVQLHPQNIKTVVTCYLSNKKVFVKKKKKGKTKKAKLERLCRFQWISGGGILCLGGGHDVIAYILKRRN